MFQAVTVTHRTPTDPFRSPRSLSVLNKRTLDERRPRSTPEALMEVPGVFVQKTNHAGGAPIIRGGVGPQVLILIDGVRLNASTYRTGPNQYLNLVDPWSIGQLEILRGAGSLAYGSYAFGGVLNVRTQNPAMTYGPSTRIQGGLVGRFSSADSERSGHVEISGSRSGFGARASFTYGAFGDLRPGAFVSNSLTQNIRLLGEQRMVYHKDAFGDLVINPDTGGQIFSRYQNLFADVKLKWRVRPGWYVEALYQRAMLFDQGRADQLGAAGSYRFYNNVRDLAYVRVRGHLPSLKTHLRFTLSGQWQAEHVDRKRFDPSNNYAYSRQTDNYDDVGILGAAVDGYTRIHRRFKLSYGLDFYHDRVFSRATSQREGGSIQDGTPTYPEGGNYTTFGGYVVGELQAWRWKRASGLYLHGGVRLNGFLAFASAREGFDAVDFQQFGYAPFGALQLLHKRDFNLSLSYAQGFRAPNLQESASIGDAGNDFEIPNPDLRPELSHTIELTVRSQWRRRISGFVTGYYSFWTDLIDKESATYKGQSTIDGKGVKRRINTNSAAVMGVEGGLGVRLWYGLSASASLTWTRGRVPGSDGNETPLSRIPPLFGRVSLRYDMKRFAFVEAFVLFAGDQREISDRDRNDPRVPIKDPQIPSRTFDGTPGWWTLNLRGGVRFPRLFRVYFSVENILDARYKYHTSGVYSPGLNARLTLELFFK